VKFTGAAAARAARDPAAPFACLVSGPDHGLVRQQCDQVQATLLRRAHSLSVQRLDEADLKADPAALARYLGGPSLFGETSLVRLRISGEACAGLILECLTTLPKSGNEGPALVVQAGDLAKSSKVRKAFEAHAWAWSLQSYEASREELAAEARRVAGGLGTTLQADALTMVLEAAAQDLDSVASEITKLAVYVGKGAEIGLTAVAAVGSGGREAVVDDAVHAAFSGDPQLALNRLGQAMAGGGNPVATVNALLRRARLLMQLRLAFDAGERASELVKDRQYGVFFKRQTEVAAQTAIWSPVLLDSLLGALVELDGRTKTGGAPGETLVSDLVLKIARRAGGQRR
jgi:DNA polymerase III subunit delta